MKKLLILSGIMATAAVQANTQLETQTVTATRLPENIINDAQFIVIDRAKIELSNAQSLPELLNLEAGFQVNRNGGRLSATTTYINGLDNKRTLVLINGERIGSATLGSTSIQLISPQQIERIEIIRGPRGALYGGDAQAGVINIITRKQSAGSQIAAAYGSDKTRELTFRTAHTFGKTNLYFNAQHDATDGYDVLADEESDDDGHERYSIATGVALRFSEQQNLSLDYQRNKGNLEYDGNNSGSNNTDFDNQALSANYQLTLKQLTLSAAAGRSESNSWSYKDSELRTPDDLIATTKNTASVIGRYQLNESHAIILGSDYLSANVAESSVEYDETDDRTTGIITGYRYSNDFVSLELGARHDNNNRFGKFRSFNTTAVLSADNGDVITISQATAYRTPTFNELYWPGYGNPDLETERSRIYSLNYSLPYDNGSLLFNGQRAVFNNQISGGDNVGKSSVDAVSVVWKQDWNQTVSSQLSQEWVDAKNDESQKRLRRISPRASKAIVTYQSGKISTQIEGLYTEGAPISDGGERLASYSVFNTSINYNASDDLTLSLRVDNIADREYHNIINWRNEPYHAPSRTWLLKSRYNF